MERPPFADDPKFRALSADSKAAVLAEWERRISADGTPAPPSDAELPTARYQEPERFPGPAPLVGGPLEQPMGAMLAAKLGMSPQEIREANEGYARGATESGVSAGILGASMAAPIVLPTGGMIGAAGRFLMSPAGAGTVAGAETLRRTGSPVQAIKTGVTTGLGVKGLGAGTAKLLKWFSRAAAPAEAVAATAAPAARAAAPVVAARTATARAAAPVAAKAESGAVEAVKKIKAARAAKPKIPETTLSKAQGEIENDLKTSIEMAKARAAGKPMRFEGPPRPVKDISNPKQAAEDLQVYIIKQHGKGMSKGQIADSLTQVYGLPDIPGPRGKSAGYWKDAVEMVLASVGK